MSVTFFSTTKAKNDAAIFQSSSFSNVGFGIWHLAHLDARPLLDSSLDGHASGARLSATVAGTVGRAELQQPHFPKSFVVDYYLRIAEITKAKGSVVPGVLFENEAEDKGNDRTVHGHERAMRPLRWYHYNHEYKPTKNSAGETVIAENLYCDGQLCLTINHRRPISGFFFDVDNLIIDIADFTLTPIIRE